MVKVIDNFLDDKELNTVIELSKNINYKNKTADNNWLGSRSDCLSKIDYNLYNNILNKAIYKVFKTAGNWKFEADLFLHKFPLKSKTSDPEEWWHYDSKASFAGVIYLNKYPERNSVTLIKNENKEIKVINNHYNRLVMYSSGIEHRPENPFGEEQDQRLTVTIFIKDLNFFIDGE